MPIERTKMIDDDLSGLIGTVPNNDWLQELYNQIDAADAAAGSIAPWIAFTFPPASMQCDDGSLWTQTGVVHCRYRWLGHNMIFWEWGTELLTLPVATQFIKIVNGLPWRVAQGFGGWPCGWHTLDNPPGLAGTGTNQVPSIRVQRNDGGLIGPGVVSLYFNVGMEAAPL